MINWTMTEYCVFRNLDYMEKEEATGKVSSHWLNFKPNIHENI